MKSLDELKELFSLFDDWMDKYAELIALGKTLPSFRDEDRIDANLVKGCLSQVWMTLTWDPKGINIQVDSDAAIVKGLAYLVVATYHGKTPEQATKIDLEREMAALGFDEHLSVNRRNGFSSMVHKVKSFAASRAIE